jgi:squalene-associated FAD-dependent desaturase
MTNAKSSKTVAIVGGGLAGLSAACALANAGYRVRLLERRPYVGGRASSYEHPGTGEVIDNCQHVLIGRCTNLIDLYARLGVRDAIRWYDQFTFVEPGGRQSVLQSTGMPAPLHSSFSFLRAQAFSWADKVAIALGLSCFFGELPPDSAESFAEWLKRHHQTHGAIERFWKPVLVSALNEDPERISVHYAAKVFRESFLSSAEAGRMGIPSVPLSELYGHAIDYIRARGGEVLLRTSVEAIEASPDGRWTLTSAAENVTADAVILALPFEGMAKLLPNLPANSGGAELEAKLAQFEHSPITGIHLWFDRSITELEHAVLLDSPMQWLFNKSLLQPEHRAKGEHYVELVVSASRALVPMQRQEIIDLAVAELARFFPVVREAQLVKAAVVKEVRATYSVRPQLDLCRPGATSPWAGIFLAGDWTATGWPATMEGAVRSGYLAAEALAGQWGEPQSFQVADLPHAGFMRLMPA